MITKKYNTTNLKLELTYSRITIKQSQDDSFRLVTTKIKREKEYSFTEQDSALVLQQKKRHWATYWVPIISWRLPTKVELHIPASFNGNLICKNRDGWVILGGLKLAELEIKNRNGKIIFSDIKAQVMNVSTNNGRAELHSIECPSFNLTTNNGKIILNGVKSKVINAKSNNGKILPINVISSELKLESKNGKIKGSKVTSATITASSHNGKIMIDDLNSDNIFFSCSNGNIITSLAGEEKQYAMDINTRNGKSIIAGKVIRGSFVYKDKEKPKQITTNTKNGKVVLTFLNKDN